MTILTWICPLQIWGKQIVLKSDKGQYNIRICKETAAELAFDTI